MLKLAHTVFPHWILPRAEEIKAEFNTLAAFALTYGVAYWEKTLGLPHADDSMLFWSGNQVVARGPETDEEQDIRFDLIRGVARVTMQELLEDTHSGPCGAIALPGSCILLSQLKPCLYVTAPGRSAHELLLDQVALERVFPGQFEIA